MYKSKNVHVESPMSPASPSPQENLETSVRSIETVSPLMPTGTEAVNKSGNRSNNEKSTNYDNDDDYNANVVINDQEPEIVNVSNIAPSDADADAAAHHHTMHLPNIIDIAEEIADFDAFSLFPRTRLQEAVRDAHLFAARDELWHDIAQSSSSSSFFRPGEWISSMHAFTTGNNFNAHFAHIERHRERGLFDPERRSLFSFNHYHGHNNYKERKPIVEENVNDNDADSETEYINKEKFQQSLENEEDEQPVEDVIPITNVAQTRQTPLRQDQNASRLDKNINIDNNNNNGTNTDNQNNFNQSEMSTPREEKEYKTALPNKGNIIHSGNIDKEMSAETCNERRARMFLFDEIRPEQTELMASVNNDCIAASDPFTCALPTRCDDNHRNGWVRRWLPCTHSMHGLTILYDLSRTLYVQLILFVLYFMCVIVVMREIFTGRLIARWFTTYVSVVYLIDLLIVCSYMKLARFQRLDQYWHIAEPFITVLLFILECLAWEMWDVVEHQSSVGIRILASVRLVIWVLHSRTRWEQLIMSLRCFCSADRRRYQANGFDLDLSFIHRNIVAMAWPAINFEKYFRNPFREVALFLDSLYPNAYCAINLSSERTYHPSLFHHHTAWFAMDDHNPIELEAMLEFCQFCSRFIACDPYSRVIAVHCKGGKGRTGAMIASLLMYMGLAHNAEQALHHFAVMRTIYGKSTFQGVQAPSQGRYVRYFEKLLALEECVQHDVDNEHDEYTCKVPHRARKITSLWLRNIPPLWWVHGIGKLWFAIIIKPSSQREVVYLSNENVTFNPAVPDPSTYTAKQFRDLFAQDENNFYRESNVIESDNELVDARSDGNINGNNNVNESNKGNEQENRKYALDTTSFWYHVEEKQEANVRHTRMDYKTFTNFVRNKLQIMQHNGIDIEHQHNNTQTNSNRATCFENARKIWTKISNKTHKNSEKRNLLSELEKELTVTLEFKEHSRLPVVDDDVVFKFFYSRNDPNPLEVPVQFWFHTFFEQTNVLEFTCDELDGPSKDIKHERYPANFAITMNLEDVTEANI